MRQIKKNGRKNKIAVTKIMQNLQKNITEIIKTLNKNWTFR